MKWLPLGIVVLASGVCWLLILNGGMKAVAAWYAFQIGLPLLGVTLLVIVGGFALVSRLMKNRSSLRPLRSPGPNGPSSRAGAPALKEQIGHSRGLDGGILASLLGCAAAVAPSAWYFGFLTIPYPASVETTKPAATVRLPANESLKVAWGGDSIEANYHAIVPDQRWAYDLLVEPYLTGSSALPDYGCFGISVLAPASGRVHLARDGEPDEVPGRPSMNLEVPFGNHVVILLPTETFLVLAHLQRGSLSVSEGDSVLEGQRIGRCGNSGNTSEPHIHIHHQRQDPAIYPVNFAEGLPLFFRDHDGPPMPEGGIRFRRSGPVATGATVRHRLP